MKIAIYGAGRFGEYIARQIQECENAKVECALFIDNNPIYSGGRKCGIPIVNVKDFLTSFREMGGVLIASADLFTAQEMAVSLLNYGYTEIYMIPNTVLDGELPIINKEGELMAYIKHFKYCKPSLPYVEYHVSDFCNLKCKRCGHFSNLVTEKKFPDIGEFRDAITGLSKKFANIRMFRLMGGEPFVNPDLDLFIYEVRKAFPYTDIRVVSNGLLLPRTEEHMIEAIRRCGAVISISQYPPTRRMVENILEFAWQNNVEIEIGTNITEFFAGLKSNGADTEDIRKVYQECESKTCYFLRKERLYGCPAIILLYENREFFGLDISEEDVYRNSFHVMDGTENGWEILKKLSRPNEFCKYCTERKWFDWSISDEKAKREDWMVS